MRNPALALYEICWCMVMEKRAVLFWGVAFVTLYIFLISKPVSCHSMDPLNSMLGEVNLDSWKTLNSSYETPEPTNDVITLVLAENRTKRPDILSRLHKYRGGWDISNKHYWASVGSTGAPIFFLAIVWFIFFAVALLVHYFSTWKMNIRGKESIWCQRICLFLLFVFTSSAAIGSILLSVGQNEFHGEALETLNYVVNQSEYTVQTLRNVTQYLLLAKTVNVAQIFLPSDVKNDIDQLNVDLDSAASTLELKTNENSNRVRKVFSAVRSSLIIISVVMLLISVLGLVISILGYQQAIHIFIITGWLLVAVTLILCGIFVVLNNLITDTCMAMGEWVENPHAETALSDILPCVDQRTTNQTLVKSKQVINDNVNMVDGFIGSVANSNPPPRSGSSFYNQSGPLVPQLCYPYDSLLQDQPCSPEELTMENASLIWQNYTCTVSANGLCSSIGRLTPSIYMELVAAVNVSYALEHYTPTLLSLQNCNFVRDAFRNITSSHCPPLVHHLRIVNAGLALISVGVMLSLALWLLYPNRPQREEVFAKLSTRIKSSCSGKTDKDIAVTPNTPISEV